MAERPVDIFDEDLQSWPVERDAAGEGFVDRLVADAHIGDQRLDALRRSCVRRRTFNASQSGRNSGYFSTSATRSNMSTGRMPHLSGTSGMSAWTDAPQRPSRDSRAALSLAKSSPAWCEERVSGDDDTSRKPLVRAIVSKP